MSTPASNAARQRAHWDGVLGADNIGSEDTPITLDALRRDMRFADTPDFHELVRRIPPDARARVIDIGGGMGAHALLLARTRGVDRVLVVDVSAARLRRLRERLALAGEADRVLLVQAAAEALPVRSGALDFAWSHSVLIHTELEAASREIARVLKRYGEAVLCEPTTSNPLVNLYRRTLAPKEWEGITRYFTRQREEIVAQALREPETRRFYVLSFFAFAWQFAARVPVLFHLSLTLLHALDSVLMAVVPGYARLAWFAVITGRGRGE